MLACVYIHIYIYMLVCVYSLMYIETSKMLHIFEPQSESQINISFLFLVCIL